MDDSSALIECPSLRWNIYKKLIYTSEGSVSEIHIGVGGKVGPFYNNGVDDSIAWALSYVLINITGIAYLLYVSFSTFPVFISMETLMGSSQSNTRSITTARLR